MSATLDTTPPARAFSKDPIWVVAETDEAIASPATVVFTISSTGPTAGETVRLQWDGYDLTFTVATSDGASALDLPVIGSDTLSDYADKFADRLRQNEILHAYFAVSRSTSGSDEIVTLTQRTLAVVDITATDGLSNVTVVANDVTAITTGANLRALLQVWLDTGDEATDRLLISLHAPYDLDTAQAQFDISAAFADLAPALPDASTIPSTLAPGSLATGVATGSFAPYYLRYADKSGTPAVAEALLRSDDDFMALLGGLSGDSLHPVAPDAEESPILHNYRRRLSATDHFTEVASHGLRKPVACEQPDWVYVLLTNEAITGVYVECYLYWSDGSESNYQPFGTTPVGIEVNKPHWFPSGYRQMKLSAATAPGGADPDAYIVAYDWVLKTADLPGDGRIDAVMYQVHDLSAWDHYLLFSNGVGGCESVALRGKAVSDARSAGQEYQSPRSIDWSVDTPEVAMYDLQEVQSWEFDSGYTEDQDWIEHLRQLAISDRAWLIDTANRRFLAVNVQPGKIETDRDDETLYHVTFTVRAAWINRAANV